MLYKNLLLIIFISFLAISGCEKSQDVSSQPPVNATNENSNIGTPTSIPTPITQVSQTCPIFSELVKKNDTWITTDNKWKSYTPSTAENVLSFLGAQWVGVKLGKVICLYKTDEAVSFPLALEQLKSQLVIEPSGYGWSALTGGRRFCKSASVADCTYFIEKPKDITNIYEEIKYNPKKS